MGMENAPIDVSRELLSTFTERLRAWRRANGIDMSVEGSAPIDTSWMREENWDLGRLAPAA